MMIFTIRIRFSFYMKSLPGLPCCRFKLNNYYVINLNLMSRTYCVSVRDRSEDLLNIKHTDGFKLNHVGALQTRTCRGMEVEIL